MPGANLPEQLGLRVVASLDAATMRPRTGLSTDDNVKRQMRIDIVVLMASALPIGATRPLWDIGCCSA